MAGVAVDLQAVQAHVHLANTILARGQVRHVAGVVRAGRLAVAVLHLVGVEVAAGAGGVGRAAVTHFMHMEAVHAAGLEAAHLTVQAQGIAVGVEGQFAGDAAALDFGQHDAGLRGQGDAAGGRRGVIRRRQRVRRGSRCRRRDFRFGFAGAAGQAKGQGGGKHGGHRLHGDSSGVRTEQTG